MRFAGLDERFIPLRVYIPLPFYFPFNPTPAFPTLA